MSRIALPGQNGGGMPMATNLQVAAPMNDVQLLAWVAAQLQGTAQERVSLATDIVVECISANHRLAEKVRARMKELEASNGG